MEFILAVLACVINFAVIMLCLYWITTGYIRWFCNKSKVVVLTVATATILAILALSFGQFHYWKQFWQTDDYILVWTASNTVLIPYLQDLLSPTIVLMVGTLFIYVMTKDHDAKFKNKENKIK